VQNVPSCFFKISLRTIIQLKIIVLGELLILVYKWLKSDCVNIFWILYYTVYWHTYRGQHTNVSIFDRYNLLLPHIFIGLYNMFYTLHCLH
jgi:hypothetical protein